MNGNNCPQAQSHDCSQAGETTASLVQIDPTASAALAEAIKSAKQGLRPSAPESQPDRSGTGIPENAAVQRIPATGILSQAAIALLLVGAGWFASYMGTLANRDVIHRLEAETARSQEILTRLSSDLEALKGTMAAFKDVEHTSSTVSASEQTKLAEKVERLAVAVQNPSIKLSALETRLDRMEDQIMSSLASLTVKPPAPAVADPVAREDAPSVKTIKTEPVDGWVLREVYNGSALIEGRNRRLYEVMPGGIIPGVGRVEAIERRGSRWVVLTDKGIIGTYR
jgi:hypothetical protein